MTELKIIHKRKKFSWIVVAALVVGAIVGSGIVRHSVSWAANGGTYAVYGLLLVWIAYFVVGIAMCDNISMMPEKGGIYAWTRKTMGKNWGTQVGWLYLVGFTCLSVILCWLAYVNTLTAVLYFLPEERALLGAMIFSVVIPMFFIVVFTITFTLGVKRTTQVIVGFFTIKVTMWLTIVGIGLLHYDASVAKNIPNIDPLWATLSVGILSLFAMNGLDASSVIADDVHEPGKNYLKGFIVGMIVVLILYVSAVVVIMGLVGQRGAIESAGIAEIFLQQLHVPPPVLLIFIVISIVGTLFINMYMVVRLSGAMAEQGDFFFSNHAKEHIEEQKVLTGQYKVEMPLISIVASTVVYAIFFALIFAESIIDPETQFVLYVIDKLALFPFLIVLFLIAFTNFKAHRMGLAKERRKTKKEFNWARGYIIPIIGMASVAFIIGLSIYMDITQPSDMLPTPEESYAWEFWRVLGLIFPALIVVPGIVYWVLWGRKKTMPVEFLEKRSQAKEANKKSKEQAKEANKKSKEQVKETDKKSKEQAKETDKKPKEQVKVELKSKEKIKEN